MKGYSPAVSVQQLFFLCLSLRFHGACFLCRPSADDAVAIAVSLRPDRLHWYRQPFAITAILPTRLALCSQFLNRAD